MRLILIRHGNTFAPGEAAVWVGKRQDLSLVLSGKQQAQTIAGVLSELGVHVQGIYCSTLRRTKEFAQILKQVCAWESAITVDQRLDELDYGSWSGLTSEEIVARGFVVDLQQWNDHSIWPANAGWEGSPELICSEVEEFVGDMRQSFDSEATIVAVTSNGRLRYFLSLDQKAFLKTQAVGAVKVKTGHASIFEISDSDVILRGWNLSPQQLAAALGSEN